MVNLDFLKKGLRIVSPPHFVYDFNMCIAIVVNQVVASQILKLTLSF